MKNFWLGCFVLCYAQSVFANPLYLNTQWQGYYLGVSAGAVAPRFELQSTTAPGPFMNSRQAGLFNHAAQQSINSMGFNAGLTGGYNWRDQHFLIGLEAVVQSLSLNGTEHSAAIAFRTRPFSTFVAYSYAQNNWLYSITPRLGYITEHNHLFFVEAGLGLAYLQNDFVFMTAHEDFVTQKVDKLKAGFILGTGVETALTTNTSIKAEYRFMQFGKTDGHIERSHLFRPQTFSSQVNFKANEIQLGVNYHFNQPQFAHPLLADYLGLNFDDWQSEIGIRGFLSNGLAGAPQPLFNNTGSMLISRLTFKQMQAFSGEAFARLDHVRGYFVKGYLGAGTITNGNLIDEDFPAGNAYSRTLSDVKGNLAYANFDVGYSFIRSPLGKIGAFVGYHYYAQTAKAYGCRQLAGALVCSVPGEFNNVLGLSEEDHYHALRLGVSTQFALTPRMNVSAETAYLPLISFKGQDNHNIRALIGPESASHGDGAMMEFILNYRFHPVWNVGLGARYWMWNMHNGSITFDFLANEEGGTQAGLFDSKRYGVFVQFNYVDDGLWQANDYADFSMDWSGIYLGAHLGSAWGNSHWDNAFGSMRSPQGRINVAGFGDTVHATGWLGGVDLQWNRQVGNMVYGVVGGFSVADVRGQNTLFTGIGGIDGRTVTNGIGMLAAKVGTVMNRAMLYVQAGGALIHTGYRLNGNTNITSLGAECQDENQWGGLVGIGVGYALTPKWVSFVEYDYLHMNNESQRFRWIRVVNLRELKAQQNVNLFNVGLLYKFEI